MKTLNFILARSNGQIKKNLIDDTKLSDLMARDKRYQVLEDSVQNVEGVEFQCVIVSKSVTQAQWEIQKTLKAGGQSVRVAFTQEAKEPKVKVEKAPKTEKALVVKAETASPDTDKEIARLEAKIAYLKALKAIG